MSGLLTSMVKFIFSRAGMKCSMTFSATSKLVIVVAMSRLGRC